MAMDPRNGEVLALGSYPSFDANVFAKPIVAGAATTQLNSRGQRRAAVQPRDRRRPIRPARRSSRSPRWRRSRRASSRRADDHRRRRVQARPADVPERARTPCYGALKLPQALKVSSDVFFYTLGERANARGPIIQDVGAQARPRPPHRDRHPRRVRRPRARRRVARRGLRRVPASAPRRRRSRPGRPRRCTRAAASSGRGPRATTSTSRSARATCRRRRCRWRPPTRRSPTAARSCARTSAMSVEDGAGRAVEEIRTPPRRAREVLRGRPGRRSWTACTARPRSPGGTSADVFKGFPLITVYGKTGTAERAGPARPVLVRRLRARIPTPPDRRRRDHREGRLRRRDGGARGAPDPLQVVRPRQATSSTQGSSATPMSAPCRPSSRPPSRRPRSSRASGACAWTRCCCWRRSGSWPAR